LTGEESKKLIESTFNNPFDETLFRFFIRNLINGIEELFSHPFTGNMIHGAIKENLRF
jgi:hypothetical protein